MNSSPVKVSFFQDMRNILNAQTATLFAASLITPAAAFMLYPFFTIYFTHTLGYSAAGAGLLLSVRFLSSALLGFIGGWASERFGLLRTYMLAGVITAVAIFIMSFQRGVVPLVVLLVITGVSASTVNACVRGLANVTVTQDNRGAVQNYVHWLNNVGMAIALPFSADVLLGGISRVPFMVTAVGYLAMAVLLGIAFRRSVAATPQRAESKPKTSALPWRILGQDRAFAFLMASFVLWAMVEMQFESNIPLDLSYHFPQGAKLYGTLGMVDMVIVFGLQLGVSRWLATKPSQWLNYIGFLLLGGLIVGGLWQSVVGWTISIVLLSVGEVFSIGPIMTLMGALPREGQHGSYFALFGMAQGLATFLAYSLGGIVYQTLHPAVLFALTLPLAALSGLLYRHAQRTHHNEVQKESTEAMGVG